jgi:hypothetical protein
MDIIHDEDFDEALDHLGKDFYHLNANQNKENNHLGNELSHRERERRMRETLQSRHGPTAEIHDQVLKV